MTKNLNLSFLGKDIIAFSDYLSKNHFENAVLGCTFTFGDFSCECRITSQDIYILNNEVKNASKTNK